MPEISKNMLALTERQHVTSNFVFWSQVQYFHNFLKIPSTNLRWGKLFLLHDHSQSQGETIVCVYGLAEMELEYNWAFE